MTENLPILPWIVPSLLLGVNLRETGVSVGSEGDTADESWKVVESDTKNRGLLALKNYAIEEGIMPICTICGDGEIETLSTGVYLIYSEKSDGEGTVLKSKPVIFATAGTEDGIWGYMTSINYELIGWEVE